MRRAGAKVVCYANGVSTRAPHKRLPRSAFVESRGAPFERGRHLGQTAKAHVDRAVAAYFRLFAAAGLDRSAVLAAAEGYAAATRSFAPELFDEMRGIADGAGHTLEDIVALNARTELLHGVTRTRGECTSLAGRGADGHVRVAQNWDWNASLAGCTVLWSIVRDDGPNVLTFVEAGIVGKIGMNAAGLGLCINLLRTDDDHGGSAVPMHVILRAVLDRATTVDDAIRLLRATPRASSCNHVVVDRAGAIADVEATPRVVYVLDHGVVVTHANHCDAPSLAGRDRTAREAPETLARGSRIAALVHDGDDASIRAALRDHATRPGSICLHPDAALPDGEREESVASIVVDVTAGTLDLADGPPCENDYVCFRPSSASSTGLT